MPAPKNPNTQKAVAAAAEARNRERDERDATRLRMRGHLVIPPENAAEAAAVLTAAGFDITDPDVMRGARR